MTASPLPDNWPARAELHDFVAAARPKLRRLLISWGVAPQDSDDLVQQSLLRLIARWNRMDEVVSRERWLLGTLRRTILKHWCRRLRSRRAEDRWARELAASEPAPQERQDAMRDLATLTGELSLRDRQLLWLRFGLELKPREAAARLGCRPDSVRKLSDRALERARRRVAAAGHR
jgi:RNA polymerase sigma factor (sigma-70 family)